MSTEAPHSSATVSAMKTILIPTEDHDSMAAVLEAARLVAKRFDSYMEGFAVHPAAAEYLTVDPLSSMTVPHVHDSDAEIERQARVLFETFMAANDVPRVPAGPRPATYSFGWVRPTAEADPFIGSYGRLFDLIVLGRPGRAPQNPRMPPLETALFESGHPVLIVPHSPPAALGRNVLVAWNGSTEQARTTTFALPLLRGAETVTVLSVEGGMTPGPTGEQVAVHLQRNGIPANAVTVAPGSRSTGETILDHGRSLGCDLLVKGAYTQSRLRQMMFGGATRHILANATLPVLMAH
jgi:nucleotide-binding universal stress UspA family protein